MKTTIFFLAVPWRLASAKSSSATTFYGGATSAAPASTPSTGSGGGGGDSASSDAICGQGFTYCGWILTKHQGFQSADVVKAYCSADKTNCVNGKTRTDPQQGLYVCLPNNASPKRGMDMLDGGAMNSHQIGSGHRGSHVLGGAAMHRLRDSAPAAAPSDQCAPGSTPTKGNRIELLCSCANKCLNPETDHIARCDASCS